MSERSRRREAREERSEKSGRREVRKAGGDKQDKREERRAGGEKREKREERRAKNRRREKQKARGEKRENCTTGPPYSAMNGTSLRKYSSLLVALVSFTMPSGCQGR